MRYVKPEAENVMGCLSVVFWPLAIPLAIFGLIFREEKHRLYADPVTEKQRKMGNRHRVTEKGKSHIPSPRHAAADIDPWDLPAEKMPWEK